MSPSQGGSESTTANPRNLGDNLRSSGARLETRVPNGLRGAACPTRTDDLPLTRRLLYQLS